MKNSEVQNILGALNLLDGGAQPYKIGVKGQYAIAKNMNAAQKALLPFEQTRAKLLKETGLTPVQTPQGLQYNFTTPEQETEFAQKMNLLADETVEVKFHKFDVSELNLLDPKNNPEGNNIPRQILSVLFEEVLEWKE